MNMASFISSGFTVNFLVHDVELIGVQLMSCCRAVEVYWGGAFKCSLTLSPSDLPDSPI